MYIDIIIILISISLLLVLVMISVVKTVLKLIKTRNKDLNIFREDDKLCLICLLKYDSWITIELYDKIFQVKGIRNLKKGKIKIEFDEVINAEKNKEIGFNN